MLRIIASRFTSVTARQQNILSVRTYSAPKQVEDFDAKWEAYFKKYFIF